MENNEMRFDDADRNLKKEYLNLNLTAGLVLGVLYAALSFLGYVFNNITAAGVIINIAGFGLIAWALTFYGKKAAAMKNIDGVGYTYGQAFGFAMITLLLSGVIIGIGQWLLQNVIDPEFYDSLMKKQLEAMGQAGEAQIAMVMKMKDMMNNIIFMVFSQMFGIAIMGGLVALITSAVVSRKPRL